jgi:hypothetical protein
VFNEYNVKIREDLKSLVAETEATAEEAQHQTDLQLQRRILQADLYRTRVQVSLTSNYSVNSLGDS